MKITTLALNPAVDQTVSVENFQANTVNRGRSSRLEPGGKGVNVASFLADLALPVSITGFLGSENANMFEALFTRKGIADHCVRLPGQTRINIKITDNPNQQTTDINLPGLSPSQESIDCLFQALERLAETNDWFVLTGSLPPGVPDDLYAQIIRLLKARGRSVALDTSRAALHAGVEAGPQIVKPNLSELEELTGKRLAGEREILAAGRALLTNAVELAVISLGKNGAMFVTAGAVLHALPPQVQVSSTVGAGDAMVAGLLYARSQGLDLDETARLATALSVARITSAGDLPAAETFPQIAAQVQVRSL